ncbi:MAG: aminomethyl-transferring glycine dehydrogenase subunit GcvPB [Spirochaetaceae bacterium]|jgi:glycine dehydrogenase subunit 2|nr:aminomethyl-transferring glycine dehydrogenase subunit GcvPB [Spirochaetaceae bacterium]
MTNQNPVLDTSPLVPPVPLLFEESVPGRRGAILPEPEPGGTPPPPELIRAALDLPELSESQVVRHFTGLSRINFSVDGQFYPLGSCTMKYNPKMNEDAAAEEGFRRSHPLLAGRYNQGNLALMYRLQESLKKLTGFGGCSLQGAAGAQGELAGMLMIRAWHLSRAGEERRRVLIPDSAHGTNPATCTMAGFTAESIPSGPGGAVDMDALRRAVSGEGAATLGGMMITNPGTLGLFEKNIVEIIRIIHDAGGLVYGDGANMNALMGIVKPADLGFDVMHLNLHKTFSTPHGGGGPGAGAILAGKTLGAFLPGPVVVRRAEAQKAGTAPGPSGNAGAAPGDPAAEPYRLESPPSSIGRIKAFQGNFGILVRAYAYIRTLGGRGLRRASEYAVLNANYLRELVKEHYPTPFGADRPCMHEFTAAPDLGGGIHTVDIAKRLIDYGFHPPTVYFPLIVKEALMAEPTETETKETLEAFAAALGAIAEEARTNPELLKGAPHNTPVGRLDETAAARNPILRYGPAE